MKVFWVQDIVVFVGCVEHDAGGQQAQVGSLDGIGGEKSGVRRESGYVRGMSRYWKRLGKKATMKTQRKMQVLRRLVSNGIGVCVWRKVTSIEVGWLEGSFDSHGDMEGYGMRSILIS